MRFLYIQQPHDQVHAPPPPHPILRKIINNEHDIDQRMQPRSIVSPIDIHLITPNNKVGENKQIINQS
jgi:hypothetical protein